MLVGFLTSEEVAVRLDVTLGSVSRWCRQGLLPGAVQLGNRGPWLIPEKALEGFKRPSPGPKRRR